MSSEAINSADQLGFDSLLAGAAADNKARKFERQTAHLPKAMDDGIQHYETLLMSHHAAMLNADCGEVVRIREEARLLAWKLNKGQPGILSGPDAPGNVLMERTAANTGSIPIWGQTGSFILDVVSILVRIELHGMLGIASHSHWLGFAIHAVDRMQPFLSETSYRSFLGVWAEPEAGLCVEAFIRKILNAYLHGELGGTFLQISDSYRATPQIGSD